VSEHRLRKYMTVMKVTPHKKANMHNYMWVLIIMLIWQVSGCKVHHMPHTALHCGHKLLFTNVLTVNKPLLEKGTSK